MFKKFYMIVLMVCAFCQTATFSVADTDINNIHHNLGTGMGIPFGGCLGLSYEFEYNINDSFSIGPTVALGTTGHNIGLHSHLLNKNNFFRIGFSIWYGKNSRLTFKDENIEDKIFNGFTVGVNSRFQFGSSRNHLLDFHILYAESSEIKKYLYNSDDVDNVLYALGYKYSF